MGIHIGSGGGCNWFRFALTGDSDYGRSLLVNAATVAVQTADGVVGDDEIIRSVEPGIIVIERLVNRMRRRRRVQHLRDASDLRPTGQTARQHPRRQEFHLHRSATIDTRCER